MRIRRRKASSSSTINNFRIAWYLLLAGLETSPRKYGHVLLCGRVLFPLVKHIAYLSDQNLFREWLVQEMGSGLENSVSCNKTVGVTRHIKHPYSWLARHQLFCQNAAVHPGHHDIGQQEIESTAEARCDFQSFFSAPGG